jgi:hypothetical protein
MNVDRLLDLPPKLTFTAEEVDRLWVELDEAGLGRLEVDVLTDHLNAGRHWAVFRVLTLRRVTHVCELCGGNRSRYGHRHPPSARRGWRDLPPSTADPIAFYSAQPVPLRYLRIRADRIELYRRWWLPGSDRPGIEAWSNLLSRVQSREDVRLIIDRRSA